MQVLVAFNRALAEASVYVEDRKPTFKEALETSTAQLFVDLAVRPTNPRAYPRTLGLAT